MTSNDVQQQSSRMNTTDGAVQAMQSEEFLLGDQDDDIIAQFRNVVPVSVPTVQKQFKTTEAERARQAKGRQKPANLTYEPSPLCKSTRKPHSVVELSISGQKYELQDFTRASETVSEQIERIFRVDIRKIIANIEKYEQYFGKTENPHQSFNYNFIKMTKFVRILSLAQTNPYAAIGAMVDHINYLGQQTENKSDKKTPKAYSHLQFRHYSHLVDNKSKCDVVLKNVSEPMLVIDTVVVSRTMSMLLETLSILIAKTIEPKAELLWNEKASSVDEAARKATDDDFETVIAMLYHTIMHSPIAELKANGQVINRSQLLGIQINRPIELTKRSRLEVMKAILERNLGNSDLQTDVVTVKIHDSFAHICTHSEIDLPKQFNEKDKIVKWHNNAEEIKKPRSCDVIEHLSGQKTMRQTTLNNFLSHRKKLKDRSEVLYVPNCSIPFTTSTLQSHAKYEQYERQQHVYVDNSGYIVIMEQPRPYNAFMHAMMHTVFSTTEIELIIANSNKNSSLVRAVIDRKMKTIFQLNENGKCNSTFAVVAYINDSLCAYEEIRVCYCSI